MLMVGDYRVDDFISACLRLNGVDPVFILDQNPSHQVITVLALTVQFCVLARKEIKEWSYTSPHHTHTLLIYL